MKKFRRLKFLLFILLGEAFAGSVLSQSAAELPDSASHDSSFYFIDSRASITHPDNNSLNRVITAYQHRQDQFPSWFIMRFNGLPHQHTQEVPVKNNYDDWQFWFAMGLLAFLAFIRFAYGKDFEELNQAFRNWGLNQQIIRELGIGAPLGTVLLNIFSSLVISFYVFLLLRHFNAVTIHPSWMLMGFSFICVEAALLMRYLLLKTAEIIFPFKKEIKLYNYYEIQINRILGVCLFPLLLLIAYSIPVMSMVALYASFVVIAALISIRYVKGFNIGISYFRNHLIHFLLYICALEIAPVLIIIRLLLNLGPIRLAL